MLTAYNPSDIIIRNATESDFRTSKMAGGSHFVQKFHKNKNCGIDLKW